MSAIAINVAAAQRTRGDKIDGRRCRTIDVEWCSDKVLKVRVDSARLRVKENDAVLLRPFEFNTMGFDGIRARVLVFADNGSVYDLDIQSTIAKVHDAEARASAFVCKHATEDQTGFAYLLPPHRFAKWKVAKFKGWPAHVQKLPQFAVLFGRATEKKRATATSGSTESGADESKATKRAGAAGGAGAGGGGKRARR